MTPDFLAGLLIGSMLVYACWLLSLRLAEPEDRLRTFDFPRQTPDLSLTADPEDAIGDALVLLDKAFSDE